MGQWISSKEFAKSFNANKKSLEKACFRANQRGKKICSIKSIIINFNYARGVGGNAGKILQIWSKPLSKEEASLIEQGFSIEDISSTNYPYKKPSTLKNSNTLVISNLLVV